MYIPTRNTWDSALFVEIHDRTFLQVPSILKFMRTC